MRVFHSERNHCHDVRQPQKETKAVSLGTHLKPVHKHSGEQIQPQQPGQDCSRGRHPRQNTWLAPGILPRGTEIMDDGCSQLLSLGGITQL